MSLESAIITFGYLLGIVCAVVALWRSRTPQGATAWIVGLVSFPFAAVPLFLVFGRNKFFGYVQKRKELDSRAQAELKEMRAAFDKVIVHSLPDELKPLNHLAHRVTQPGFTDHNHVQLLVDGTATYAAMLNDIKVAKKLICIQFYIFRTDDIGQEFINALIERAQAGVTVLFLYDAIGCRIGASFIKKMASAGVQSHRFESTKGWNTRLQINFRNHRKILVVDEKIGFVGGLNIGDDYLGKWPTVGPWRDTHVRIEGPGALACQIAFIKDWHWITGTIPDLPWSVTPAPDHATAKVLALHTGPADAEDAALLSHISLFNSAKRRIWIANPYFLPPEGIMAALNLAALRGVEVKVIVPSHSDNRLADWASEIYQQRLMASGVQIYKYAQAFLHQKVLLVDDTLASVGSTNLDSRSIFINFEIAAVIYDEAFSKAMEKMLEKDFSVSVLITANHFRLQSKARQCLARAACLFSPML